MTLQYLIKKKHYLKYTKNRTFLDTYISAPFFCNKPSITIECLPLLKLYQASLMILLNHSRNFDQSLAFVMQLSFLKMKQKRQ